MDHGSMRRWKAGGLVLFALLATIPAGSGAAAGPRLAGTTGPPAGAASSGRPVVVPDRFLRRWDPVTIFFAKDTGPAIGGPEDRPDRYVRMSPAHPGAFAWLDGRTLQFRPAEPWPPLARFTFSAGKTECVLSTLMSAPAETEPGSDAEGLPPVDAIRLVFPEPMEPRELARMITLELRPLPGIGTAGREKTRFLTQEDFRIKVLERGSRADAAGYVVVLDHPIPFGTRAILRLRLTLEDDPAKAFVEVPFATAEPFRIVEAGVHGTRYPLTPEGSRFSRDKAIRGSPESRQVVVRFSAPPKPMGPVEARNLVRLTPAVDNLSFAVQEDLLVVSGDFSWETPYKVSLVPTPLADTRGRPLEMKGESEFHVYFPRKHAFLRWAASQGVAERLGPKRVPVQGRGQERVDVRIHAVDPLDRSFWPFPSAPVTVNESQRPPGPGETPAPFVETDRDIGPEEIAARIASLGSPPVSRIVSLPLRREGGAASFGLDLSEHLEFLTGKDRPGHYLVGLRRLDSSTERAWIRLQVTDLCLTAVEEPESVRFAVTSLATGSPVPGARVRLEASGRREKSWETLCDGATDAKGEFRWRAPGNDLDKRGDHLVLRRIVVEKDADVLVLDPAHPPERYADNHWAPARETWLQWALQETRGRRPEKEVLGHVFTERPVYRPEEEVHIKGYVRARREGRFAFLPLPKAAVVVNGPGDLSWRYPVTLTQAGSYHHAFSEKDLPTGEYTAHLEDERGEALYGRVSFRMEAYRIPEFEVTLHAPDIAPLDNEFRVSLTAVYYAGGRVAGRPVRWRVTQFPYTWSPKAREGFLYSSDGRYSRMGRFQASPRLEREGKTDDQGGASLVVNPAIEPTAQPRSYVVEATVTGADDQTVTATRSVHAVPAFVLGIKAPRYLEKADKIAPEVIVVGPDGEPLPGKVVTVRLFHRQWHSVLRESDFSSGAARYVTDVVDEKVSETTVTSIDKPLAVPLALPEGRAGVYVVEIEARDRLDRTQSVAVDLYAGGVSPVAWEKPASRVFTVATDRASYAPGDTAALVIKSPFQAARALAIVEEPDGNRYAWVDVANGAATFKLPIRDVHAPRIPVHFILMRGRVPGASPAAGAASDPGKPATVAATTWVKVDPVANRVEVALEHPEKAGPGQKIEIGISLSAPGTKGEKGKPLPGEVTLWLVDEAVLALGKPQRLDMIPDFLKAPASRIAVRDTRTLPFGLLPFLENPGGDEGAPAAEAALLDKVTVRKNFKPVPYYNPAIAVGPDGKARVAVELPDNLTNFKIIAKAVSGAERFGHASSRISVRLPLIVQPALPRFVRPGDSFRAAAVGRVVEGEGGAGTTEIRTVGATLKVPARRELSFVPNRPERIEFPVEIPTPPYGADGKLKYKDVTFRVAVKRSVDNAADAFELSIPVREDRRAVERRVVADLAPGVAAPLPDVEEPARPGTVRRSVLVSDQPALVRMAAGLDFLHRYPYGCTEQRLSLARARLALKKFRDVLRTEGADRELARSVQDTIASIGPAVDQNGLVAFWPASPGSVSLTAWVVEFLVEAKEAGFPVDGKLFDTLSRSLTQALRSDYSRFIDGESFNERAFALSAMASAGKLDAAYGAELARKSQYLSLEGVAETALAFARSGEERSPVARRLEKELWDGVVFRLHQGREVYGGLQDRHTVRNPLILPSETRTLADVTRSLARLGPGDRRLQQLVDALVVLGRGDGWGTTNANASALLALSQILDPAFPAVSPATVDVRFGQGGPALSVSIKPGQPLGHLESGAGEPGEAVLRSPGGGKPVVMRAEVSYVPLADGSQAPAESQGFVVSRELLRYGIRPGDKPDERVPLDIPGMTVGFATGEVVEEHVRVVNPAERHFVAVVVPLAAGMEPLNPNLATAPPEAAPAGRLTQAPTYAAYKDDHVAFYFDTLPKGTYDFYFRTRATTPGSFIQPAAAAELMYDGAVRGNSPGARVDITRKD